MAKGAEVLSMLIPSGGWVIRGDKYEDIEWLESEHISKEEFEAGFARYDAWKAEQDAKQAAARVAAENKLAALGLDLNDLKALGL